MIQAWRKRQGELLLSNSKPAKRKLSNVSRQESDFIEDELIPVFSWLNIEHSLWGHPSLGLYTNRSTYLSSPNTPESLPPAKTLDDAVLQVTDLMNSFFGFVQGIGISIYDAPAPPEAFDEQARLKKLFWAWRANFERLVRIVTRSGRQSDRHTKSNNLLRALWTAYWIWLHRALEADEMSWDTQIPVFATLISHIEDAFASDIRDRQHSPWGD